MVPDLRSGASSPDSAILQIAAEFGKDLDLRDSQNRPIHSSALQNQFKKGELQEVVQMLLAAELPLARIPAEYLKARTLLQLFLDLPIWSFAVWAVQGLAAPLRRTQDFSLLRVGLFFLCVSFFLTGAQKSFCSASSNHFLVLRC
ncbi:MAG: hypothetical protein HY399_05815 [Elusimicrobia bacterium]|nr:hypothetical protein [Elusimicrobiota bacterium]